MCLRLLCEVTRLVVHGDVWACGGISDDLELGMAEMSERVCPRC